MAGARKNTSGRNPSLQVSGGVINRYGRSQSYHRRGVWAIKNKATPAKQSKAAAPAPKRLSRYYPADEHDKRVLAKRIRQAKPARKSGLKVRKARASLQPGRVLILLAGPFRGKRVVLVKVLESGLLLVTGPFKINGVPLRRVNAAYVIATDTSCDVSKVIVSDALNDEFFTRPAERKHVTKSSEDFLGEENERKRVKKVKRVVDDDRKKEQACVDDGVLVAVKAVPSLDKYLRARFSLRNADRPHLMKF